MSNPMDGEKKMSQLTIRLRVGDSLSINDTSITKEEFNAGLSNSFKQGFVSIMTLDGNVVVPWDNIAALLFEESKAS